MQKKLAVIIMAAGKGTRMNSPDTAKVMFTINNKPMIDHVVDLAMRLDAARVIVIVGWQKKAIMDHLAQSYNGSVECIEQNPQLGTGHAVMQAEHAMENFAGDVLVLSGDVPLMSYETANLLVEAHRKSKAQATVLTAVLEDATGYGRILRNADGTVLGIIEHKDATGEQRGIKEINSGIYVFDAGLLFESLKHITPANAQKEYYLTDVFQGFRQRRLDVNAVITQNPIEIQGINTVEQLEGARRVMALKS